MKILSIGKIIEDNRFNISNTTFDDLALLKDIKQYQAIVISGGDGSIRRTIKALHSMHQGIPNVILNASGSFNVIAKWHRVRTYLKVLDNLASEATTTKKRQKYYTLNDEVFLFSAGNMGDLQHIFLAETLRFGVLKKGIFKYLLSLIFLLPLHIVMTPFMLLSSQKFFVLTPLSSIYKLGSFYGKVEKKIIVDLKNSHNLIELDGDIVTIAEPIIEIDNAGEFEIIC